MAEDDQYVSLNRDTTNEQGALDPDALVLDGDCDPVDLQIHPDLSTIVIRFASSADGRGFSLAKHCRNRLAFQGELQAIGGLIPDQVSAAFSCGFDAVLVTKTQQEQYGLQHWLDANIGHDKTHYWASGGKGMRQAWAERAL